MHRTLFQRLSILFEFSGVSSTNDLLKMAKTARENKSRLPDGTLFMTNSDRLTKTTIKSFIVFYAGKNKGCTRHRNVKQQ